MELAHRDGEELLALHGTPQVRAGHPAQNAVRQPAEHLVERSEQFRRDGDDHAGRSLALFGEAPTRGAGDGRGGAEVHVGAEPAAVSAAARRLRVLELRAAGAAAGDAAFGQRYGETALGAVVSAPQQARLDGRAKLALPVSYTHLRAH